MRLLFVNRSRCGLIASNWGMGFIFVLLTFHGSALGGADETERLREIVTPSKLRSVAAVWILESEAEPQTFFYSKDEPVSKDTVFRAGSVSKLVVSLLALRASEAGVLSLDEPFRLKSDSILETNLAQLLEHTSGLSGSPYSEYVSVEPGRSPAEYVENDLDPLPRWKPGRHFSYSNGGYAFAGAVIAERWGEDFDSLLRREVFGPLGMSDSHFAGASDSSDLAIASYGAEGTSEEPRWIMSVRPAGALHTTLSDLTRLLEMLLSEGELPNGDRFLQERSILRMHRGETSIAGRAGMNSASYGLGNFGFLSADRLWRGHWGKTEGFITTLGYLPEEDRGFVILANTADGAGMARLREEMARLTSQGLAIQKEASPSLRKGGHPPARAVPGYYLKFTHEMPFRSWIFEWAEAKKIRKNGTGISVSPLLSNDGLQYEKTEQGWFQNIDLPIATGVFYRDEKKIFWIEGDSWKRVSGPIVGIHLLTFGGVAVWLVLALLAGATGTVSRVFSRKKNSACLESPSFFGMLAALALVCWFTLFTQFGLMGGLGRASLLGEVTFLSISLFLLSLAFALFVLKALWKAWRMRSRRQMFLHAMAVPFLMYLFFQGWIPMVSWKG
ncbi:MAG: serine hydrolase domain-containing protein [Verrucomicrobiota bacterium]